MFKSGFNYLYYILLPILLFIIFKLAKNYGQETNLFFGSAENKETQINLDIPVLVNKIYVRQGQYVKKGDVLLEVSQSDLDEKQFNLDANITEWEIRKRMASKDWDEQILKLNNQKEDILKSAKKEIQLLQAEQNLNAGLLKNLKTGIKIDSLGKNNLIDYKIKAIQDELEWNLQALDKEITAKKTIRDSDKTFDAGLDKFKQQKKFLDTKQNKLRITAPSDGLIGTIHCKEGENLGNYTTMISFYEQSPNVVVAYVPEGFLVHLKIGDSIEVRSNLHPQEIMKGIVSGLGYRIVEIPERLRKIPELKTFGREVLVQLPLPNPFLQNEAVILTIHSNTSLL